MQGFSVCILFMIVLWNICFSQELAVKTEEEFYTEYIKAYQKSQVERMELLVQKYPYWADEYVRKLFVGYLSFLGKDKPDMAKKYMDIAKLIAQYYKKFFAEDFFLTQAYFYENLSEQDKKKAFQAILLSHRAKLAEDSIYLFSIEKQYQEDLDKNKITENLREKWKQNDLSLSFKASITNKTDSQEWIIEDGEEDITKKYLLLKNQLEIAVYHIDLYKEALDILKKIGATLLIGITATNMGEQAYTLEQILDAEKYFLQAKSSFEKIQDIYGLAKIMNLLGMSAYCQKNYSLAFSYYEKSLDILKTRENPPIKALTLKNWGILEQEQKHYDLSKKYFGESLQIYTALRDSHNQETLLANLGLIAYLQKEYPNAIQYLEQSSRLARILNKENDLVSHLGLLATIHAEMGNHKKSEFHLEEKLTLAKKHNNITIVMDSLSELARLSLIQGKKEKAKEYYQHKLAIVSARGDIKEKQDIEERIARLEYQQKLQYLLWGTGCLMVFVLVYKFLLAPSK